MKVTKVCCQSCGADLDVDESIRLVTCNFCGARLEIVHDETTTHSRLLQELGEKTDRMAGEIKVLRLQNELEQLEREWQSAREGLMITGKNGNRSVPSVAGSLFAGGMMIVVGIIAMTALSNISQSGFTVLVPLIIIGIGVASMIHGTSKASRYETAEADFTKRRNEKLRQLEEAKREA
ncbi:hypothetical protein HAHE_39150 [Haloferula helveola]|uniref:Zinc ribbon domain-containing protein n=1 Tax=Haloferula helveola TaxID=490095 RepID=A0ABM7RK47_9BACT|nr:hypothetical protein HAHE_39150 [Haloferula helveola]